MKGAFLGILLALTPLGCAPATQQAVEIADQVNTVAQCARFQEARERMDAIRERLTKSQVDRAIVLSYLAEIHCITSLPELTDQLLDIAEAAP